MLHATDWIIPSWWVMHHHLLQIIFLTIWGMHYDFPRVKHLPHLLQLKSITFNGGTYSIFFTFSSCIIPIQLSSISVIMVSSFEIDKTSVLDIPLQLYQPNYNYCLPHDYNAMQKAKPNDNRPFNSGSINWIYFIALLDSLV